MAYAFIDSQNTVVQLLMVSAPAGKTDEDVRTELESSSGKTVLTTDDPDAVLGAVWDGEHFTVQAPPVVIDPAQWFIDLGPFYDRFGAAKMAVLTSTDPGVKAIVADVGIRKWIDLKRPDVAQALAYIGSVVPALTPALQAEIVTAPVTLEENIALRRLYFK